jgi:hypothetical protein
MRRRGRRLKEGANPVRGERGRRVADLKFLEKLMPLPISCEVDGDFPFIYVLQWKSSLITRGPT